MKKIKFFKRLKSARRSNIAYARTAYAALILICFACVLGFLGWYFESYGRPYMAGEIIDLSEGWKYDAGGVKGLELSTLRTGPNLGAGETRSS